MRGHLRLFFILIAVTIVLIATYVRARQQPHTLAEPEPRELALLNWQRRPFADFGSRGRIKTLVVNIAVDLNTQIDTVEYRTLLDTVTDFIAVYNTCDYAAFNKFRTNRKGQIVYPNLTFPQKSKIYTGNPDYQQFQHHAEERALSQTDEDRFKEAWYRMYKGRCVWTGMDSRDARIMVIEDQLDRLHGGFGEQITQIKKHYGVYSTLWGGNPMVTYPITRRRKHKYALFAFVAKHPEPDPARPFLVWFRFEPSIKNWVPDAWESLYAGQRTRGVDLHF